MNGIDTDSRAGLPQEHRGNLESLGVGVTRGAQPPSSHTYEPRQVLPTVPYLKRERSPTLWIQWPALLNEETFERVGARFKRKGVAFD